MSSDDIVTTRLIDASPEQLFEAVSDPAQLALWWGPQGFTNTFAEFDFRPGGAWNFTMHDPEGTDYPNESEFVEIEKPGRIVFDHLRPMHWFRMTMTFVPESGKTRLTWQMRFESRAESDKFREFIVIANEQNLDRLEAHLARHHQPLHP
jgi:uncharacterized protein YndB with AHSA1/START domain